MVVSRLTGVGGLSLAFGVLLLVVFAGVVIASYWPDRQYMQWPRGVFPRGEEPAVGRYRGGQPPMRIEPPEFTPAEAAYVSRDASISELTAATLVDLAVRGYVSLVEFEELGVRRSSVVVVLKKPADTNCDRLERDFLGLLEHAGAAESHEFSRLRPFDGPSFRIQLQDAGLAVTGTPSVRVSGMRRSVSKMIGREVSDRAMETNGWFIRWKQKVASVGALHLLVGGALTVTGGLFYLFGALPGFWVAVAACGALAGLVSLFGTEGRSARGSVARDQVLGFKRFLVDAHNDADASFIAKQAGWAVALGCVDEWASTLTRIAPDADVARLCPWLVSTRHQIATWRDAADTIGIVVARLHSEESANDSRDPLPPMPLWASFDFSRSQQTGAV